MAKFVPLKLDHFTRRQAIAVLAAGAPALLSSPLPADIKIAEVHTSYEDFLYRTPIKFGGSVVDRVTLCNVRCRVEGRIGKSAIGFGSMSMGNVWSFPSKKLTYAQTLGAMKDLAERIAKLTAEHKEWGHPIDLNVALAAAVFRGCGGDFEESRRADTAALHAGYRQPLRCGRSRCLRKTAWPELFSDAWS